MLYVAAAVPAFGSLYIRTNHTFWEGAWIGSSFFILFSQGDPWAFNRIIGARRVLSLFFSKAFDIGQGRDGEEDSRTNGLLISIITKHHRREGN